MDGWSMDGWMEQTNYLADLTKVAPTAQMILCIKNVLLYEKGAINLYLRCQPIHIFTHRGAVE